MLTWSTIRGSRTAGFDAVIAAEPDVSAGALEQYASQVDPEVVLARELTVGNVVRIDGEEGWWEIEGLFNKAGQVLDIDLVRTGDDAQFQWFICLDHQVYRAL